MKYSCNNNLTAIADDTIKGYKPQSEIAEVLFPHTVCWSNYNVHLCPHFLQASIDNEDIILQSSLAWLCPRHFLSCSNQQQFQPEYGFSHTDPASQFSGLTINQANDTQKQATNQLITQKQETKQMIRQKQATNQMITQKQATNQLIRQKQATNQLIKQKQATNQMNTQPTN